MCETASKLGCKVKGEAVIPRLETELTAFPGTPRVILLGEKEFDCLRKESAMETHVDYLKIHPKTYSSVEIVQVKAESDLRVF